MKKYNLVILIFACLACYIEVKADTFEDYKNRAMSQFNRYKNDQERKFMEYRDKVNSEFASYMSTVWPEYNVNKPVPAPVEPEPPKPFIANPDNRPEDTKLPEGRPVPLPAPLPTPVPLLPKEDVKPSPEPTPAPKPEPTPAPKPEPTPAPKPEPEPTPAPKPTPSANEKILTVNYYGTPLRVTIDKSLIFQLPKVSENDVAKVWKSLSSDKSLGLIRRCVQLRDSLNMTDWGYVQFARKLSEQALSGRKSDVVLLQMFILAQSGYKVRIGSANDNLILLFPSRQTIFDRRFVVMEGEKFYIADNSAKLDRMKIFNRKFPGEQLFSLYIDKLPSLSVKSTQPKLFKSNLDNRLSCQITLNKNLIDFYNDFPRNNHWDIYANASLSQNLKKQLYPVLKADIDGKDIKTATNILLHFVQTAFDYKTDDEQFGSERSLFGDETFFYPFSDCEDRAILFSILVRELIGLDVVLLHYPGHIATAVCFGNNDVTGDYMTLDGKRYIVCDPTYINSNVGQSMPQFKSSSAEIIKLKRL